MRVSSPVNWSFLSRVAVVQLGSAVLSPAGMAPECVLPSSELSRSALMLAWERVSPLMSVLSGETLWIPSLLRPPPLQKDRLWKGKGSQGLLHPEILCLCPSLCFNVGSLRLGKEETLYVMLPLESRIHTVRLREDEGGRLGN